MIESQQALWCGYPWAALHNPIHSFLCLRIAILRSFFYSIILFPFVFNSLCFFGMHSVSFAVIRYTFLAYGCYIPIRFIMTIFPHRASRFAGLYSLLISLIIPDPEVIAIDHIGFTNSRLASRSRSNVFWATSRPARFVPLRLIIPLSATRASDATHGIPAWRHSNVSTGTDPDDGVDGLWGGRMTRTTLHQRRLVTVEPPLCLWPESLTF